MLEFWQYLYWLVHLVGYYGVVVGPGVHFVDTPVQAFIFCLDNLGRGLSMGFQSVG